MASFSVKVNKAIEGFGEYIGSDVARGMRNAEIREINTGALKELIAFLNTEIRKLIDDYNKSAFNSDHCGELDFQNALSYFNNRPSQSGSFRSKGNIDFSKFENRRVKFSKDSLNLYMSRISLYALYQELNKKIENGNHAILPVENDDENDEKGKSEFDPFLVRQLIMYYCIWLSGEMSLTGLFTFGGERFIADGADKDNVKDKKNEAVEAVMFRESESLCSIDSLRFLEKCKRQIEVKLKEDSSCEKTLRIAFIGKLRDPENGISALECLVQKKYEAWKIIPTFFSLKQLSTFAVEVVGIDESSATDRKIEGNLFDRNFYIETCRRFDIICLLDAGYLYTDINKFSDAYGDTPYSAVKSRLDSLISVSKLDGIEEIGNRPYDGVYTSIIKWIENQFYGKKHSFAFDPRIFYTLASLGNELGSRSLYLFLSRDRGKALSSTRRYRNLCKGEFFEGREVIAYDWSNHKEIIPEELVQRNSEILANRFSESNIMPIRLWKLIKSMGRFFYSNEFVNLFVPNSDEDKSYAVPFIEYASKTWVYVDYSEIKDNKLFFRLKEEAVEATNQSCTFGTIAKLFVTSLLRIALDARCFEDCASGFCRRILYNTITTDAIGFEHLLLAQKLWDKTFFTGDMDISYREDILDIKAPESESFALYVKHQEDNIALIELIDSINHSDYMDDDYLIKLFSSALPDEEGRDNSKLSARLVLTSSAMCEKMGYFACKLY